MKIAIVTGASSGMGKEIITQIADRFSGIDEIWAIARRKDRLEELKKEVPVPVRILALDLSGEAFYGTLLSELDAVKPDVKILVNAAGFGQIGAVSELSLSEQTGMVRVNCEALCGITGTVLPYLSANSRIIQFASSAAFLPQPDFAVYAASKAFVLSYSRALNRELKFRDISVTAVCPGPVKTEFFDLAEKTGVVPIYKKLVMADPKKVVRLALRDSMMGKSVSVYGITMKAFELLCKVVPHDLILDVMEQLQRKDPHEN